MRWQFKWVKNAAFGVIPFSDGLRKLKRRYRPYPTDIPDWTLEEGLRQIELLREAGCELRGARLLEIGTGWQPIIPLLYAVIGVGRTTLIDMQRLMDARTLQGTCENLKPFTAEIAVRLGLDEEEVVFGLSIPADVEAIADERERLSRLLTHFRFEYLAPCNLGAQNWEEGCFDVISSRAVLEHVPPHVLRDIFASTHRLLKPGGYCSHLIDNSDHWSHQDKRISRVNFLRYSDRAFDLLNRFNPLDYQNRLRHPEYAALLREAGFEIVIDRSRAEPEAVEALQTLPLAERFQQFSAEELSVLDSYFVARRPLAATRRFPNESLPTTVAAEHRAPVGRG